MAEDRVRIYQRTGIGLCDPKVTVERNLDLITEGEAEFDIVTTDPACRDDFLRFGNWLLVENSKLESWVGMIDEIQEWHRFYVHVHAFTPERQLMYRDVPKGLRMSMKAGSIFKEIINFTNRVEPTPLQVGDIWVGGGDMPQENLTGDHLADYLASLVERSNCEYNFVAAPFNGKLTIYGNWYQRLGVDTQFPLEESWNLSEEDNGLRIQGKVANDLQGFGSGQSTSDRPLANYEDAASISKYGRRQGTKSYSDYTGAGAVMKALKNEINQTREPDNVFQYMALDQGDTWLNLHVGSSYPLRIWSLRWGIKSRVRLSGWYYNPFNGGVQMKLMEVLNDVVG